MSKESYIPVWLDSAKDEVYWLSSSYKQSFRSDAGKFFFYKNLKKQNITSSQELALAAKNRRVNPRLFIFHTGRCGSTLLLNSFSSHPHVFTWDEPSAIIGINRELYLKKYDEKFIERLFKGALSFCQESQREKDIIVKFHSAASLKMSFYQKTYPQCPTIFMHRDPKETIASYLDRPPYYFSFGAFQKDSLLKKREKYRFALQSLVRHLALIYESADQQMKKNSLVINYSDMNFNFCRNLHKKLNFQQSPQLKNILSKYSKNLSSQSSFQGDERPEFILEIVQQERAYIQKKLNPWYEKFKKLEI